MTGPALAVNVAFWAIALLAFARLPVHRAILTTVFSGWMFLPVVRVGIPGFIDYTKASAISFALIAGLLLARPSTRPRFRWRGADLIMAGWCLSGALSALSVGTGSYDAVSAALNRTVLWAVPYLAGRLYLGGRQATKDLVWAMFLGGLVYAPLALWELRMSPQFHHWVYGYHQHAFAQTIRGPLFRPHVFMHHGLELAMFMVLASVAGLALWRHARVRSVFGIPFGVLVAVVVGTALVIPSIGARMLLIAAIPLVLLAGRPSMPVGWVSLLGLAVAYVTLRASGSWDAAGLAEIGRQQLSEDRAASLAFRLDAENQLIDKGLRRPWFGWTPWTFKLLQNDGLEQSVITDSRWIIAFLQNGVIGLAAWSLAYLTPIAAVIRKTWRAACAARVDPYLTVLGLALTFHWLDSLVNAFESPIVILAMGATVTTVALTTTADAAESTPHRALAPSRIRPRDDSEEVDRAPEVIRSRTRPQS